MCKLIPNQILKGIDLAHSDWRPILEAGLEVMAQADPRYLAELAQDDFLPDRNRLFAAFLQPIDTVRFVLVGEGPYPRSESATGFCFMDGAVGNLWSETGLSKKVNRATSLRNFMKMLLVADGQLSVTQTTGSALLRVGLEAKTAESTMIQTLDDLQDRLHQRGFLLLNATLVYRAHVPPTKESKAWLPFVHTVLKALVDHADRDKKSLPKLILWGKIAEKLVSLPISERFPKAVSEHPYNLSFIANPVMQELFGSMSLLRKTQ